MVGMTLSLISILAMLSLYKNMVGVSVQSIQDSRQDGQIAAALLTAQQELRNAGFWIDIPSTAIKLLYGASLTNGTLSSTGERAWPYTTEVTGNALVWMYQTSSSTATATCAGLLVQGGKLMRLQGSSSCTSLSPLSNITWTTTTLIENNQPSDFFKAVKIACWPFGKAVAPISIERVKVTMIAVTSVLDSTSTASAPVYLKSTSETCLPNLVTST